jgi:two-component system, LytTR family, response regulator
VDYLTKPLTEERFDATLGRVRERLRLRRQDQQRDERRDERRYAPHLVTRIGTRDVIIPLDTIDYVEADDVYAAVFARGRRHLVRTPLDVLERTLDPALFARIHRSYIVRLDRVTEVRRERASGPEIVLDGGITLPVSRRRRAVLDALLKPLGT